MTDVRRRNLVLRLQRGDITALAVDAVVSSSNNRLWMGGGVAGALRSAGGREIEAAAICLGPVPVGEAVVTSGGRLKAKYVIHAATTGMDFTADVAGVRRAVRSALLRARELGITSLAIPALGAGMGGLPPEVAATALVDEISRETRQASRLREVTLVAWDGATYEAFDQALQTLTEPR